MKKLFLLLVFSAIFLNGGCSEPQTLLEKIFLEIPNLDDLNNKERNIMLSNYQNGINPEQEDKKFDGYKITECNNEQRYICISNYANEGDPRFNIKYWVIDENNILIGVNTINYGGSEFTFYNYSNSKYTPLETNKLLSFSIYDFFSSKEDADRIIKEDCLQDFNYILDKTEDIKVFVHYFDIENFTPQKEYSLIFKWKGNGSFEKNQRSLSK